MRICKKFRFSLMLAGCICAGAAEYEINLARNPEFQPGLDRQGPADWIYYGGPAGITNSGLGDVEFFDGGITIAGAASLHQFYMWDDVTPQYQFSCRLKSTSARGGIYMELRDRVTGNRKRHELVNRKLDEWEELSMTVGAGKHYGFGLGIHVPQDATLSISHLRITPMLTSATNLEATLLIEAAGGSVRARGIITSANPRWPEIMAAHELRLDVWLVTGVVLPVLAGAPAEQEKGYIRLKNLEKIIPDRPPANPAQKWRQLFRRRPAPADPEANGFRIICKNGRVDLIGGNDAGLLAGVMHLAEIMGVKYYAPRVFTVDAKPGFEIKDMDITRQPAFEWADGVGQHQFTWTPWKYGFLYSESSVAPSDKASPPCRASWVHPPAFLAPPFLFAKDHPDYYALVNGKRLDGYRGRNAGDLQLCLGNPALQKAVADRIMRLMEQYPQAKYFSIGQGDGLHWCECELCTTLDADKTVLTDRMVAYANAVAEITSKKYPDRKLLVLAYANDREDVPLREKLHPNVAVMYAFWPSSWPDWTVTYCALNQRGLKLLNDWNEYTGTNLTLFLYPVNTPENAEKIKLAHDKGVRGFYHCGWRGDFPETTIYTTGKLIWNPDADVRQLVDEVMPAIYGKASAPYMHKYYDMHHKLIREFAAGNAKNCQREQNMIKFRRLPLDYTQPALDLLTRAEAAASGDEGAIAFIHTEKHKVLYAYINEFLEEHDYNVPDELFGDYASKMAELVGLARTCRVPFAGYKISFTEWLFQSTGGALDFARAPYQWWNDKKIDEFLANPAKALKNRGYLQEELENGFELPAKAWLGSRFYENYRGQPAAVVRRRSSPESQVRAYFKLNKMPTGAMTLELQGLDNEKEEKAEIEITLNGQKIFAGPVDFPKNKWDWQKLEIPAACLQAGDNVLVIANTLGDYKPGTDGQTGAAGPAEEALAKNYSWGWCMLGRVRLTWGAE